MKAEPTVKAVGVGFIALALTALSLLKGGSLILVFASLLAAATLAVAYAEATRAAGVLSTLRVERRTPTRTAEGVEDRVTITVENLSVESLPYLTVEDRPPSRSRASGYKGRVGLGPRERAEAWYVIRPAPGYQVFTGILLSTGDPLGLFKAYRQVKAASSITVMPLSLKEAARGGHALGAVEPIVSRARGASLEYYQIREYQYGDDLRYASWTATARTGRLMVWEGLSDVRVDVAVYADLSGPSWPGTPGDAPADWIMRIALTAASQAVSSGGSLWYTILRGEVWEVEGPLKGSDAIEALRLRLSLVGPDNSTFRVKLEDSLYSLLSRTPPSAAKIILLAPGVSLGRVLGVLEEFPSTSCTTLVLLVAPVGGSPFEEAVRRVEEKLYREWRHRFARIGVGLGLVASKGEAFSYAARIGRMLSRGSLC